MKIIHASNKIEQIGYQTENDRTQVLFDLSDIMQDFPSGMPSLVIRRPGEENATPAFSIEMNGTDLVWTVGAYEIEHKGMLKAQIIYTVSETIVKTKIYCFNVNESLLNIDPEPPEWQDWVSELLSAASGVYDDVQQAKQAADTATEKAAIAVRSADTAQAEAALATRRANDADQSAQIAVRSADTAQAEAALATRRANDADQSAQRAETAVGQYNNMTAEANKLPAEADPTAEIDHSGDHPVLKIGIPGTESHPGTLDYEDLNNKPSIDGVTLSGDKTLHELGIAAESDIPAVPTKVSQLQNDSGYLTQETDPTVANWAKQPTKPSYTAQEVGAYAKPAGGIPASDLAEGVIPDVSGFYTKPANGIPATDLAEGVIPDVSGFYTKPAGGIPASDLAPGVVPDVSGLYTKPVGGIPASDLAPGVVPDVQTKADKVQNATNNNFAALDANGNLKDSGHKHSDYTTAEIVSVSPTQPSDSGNKLWIKPDAEEEYTVPSYAEHQALSNALSELKSETSYGDYDKYTKNSGIINSSKNWTNVTSANYKHVVIPVESGDTIKITAGNNITSYALLTSYTTPVNNAAVPFSSETGFNNKIDVSANTTVEFVVPSDAVYLIIYILEVGIDRTPIWIGRNGVNVLKTTLGNIGSITKHLEELDKSANDLVVLSQKTSYTTLAECPVKQGVYNSSGNWTNISANYLHAVIQVKPNDVIEITGAEVSTWCAILKSYSTPVAGNPIPFSDTTGFTGPIGISANAKTTITAPSDAAYLIIGTKSSGSDKTPDVIAINGIDIKNTPVENLAVAIEKTAEVETQEAETEKKRKQLEESIHFYAIPAMEQHSGMIKAAGTWDYINNSNHDYRHVIIPVSSGDTVRCAGCITSLAFLRSYAKPVVGQAADFSTEEGYTNVKSFNINNDETYVVPSDTHFLYVKVVSNGTPDNFSGTLAINDVSIVKPLVYTIQKILNPEKTINWCAMGDSITYGYWSEFNDGGGASSHVLDRENIGWAFLVAKENNWNLTNIAIGGEGYLDQGSGTTYRGYTQARNTDFSNYDLVTVALGINDWKANSQMGSMEDDPTAETITAVIPAMRATLEAIMTSNPSCKIIVITPFNANGYEHSYGTQATNWGMGYQMSNTGTLKQFRDKMIEVCELYGIQYIDMSSASCINSFALPTMLPDGVHPAIDTHKLLARELAKKITF